MAKNRNALIERLFVTHGSALQAFFRRRIRGKPEAPDLTQEVYLRMLRVADADVIRNPEGYLYTVASNLLKERAVIERRLMAQQEASEAELDQMLATFPLQGNATWRPARLARAGPSCFWGPGSACDHHPARPPGFEDL